MSGTTPQGCVAIGTPRAANRKPRTGSAACSAAWLTATIWPTTCSLSTSTATGAPTPCAARRKFCAGPRRACSISAAAPATSCWPSPRQGAPCSAAISAIPCWSPPATKSPRGARPPSLFESDALTLPLRDASLDLLTVAFGFRNLANYEAGLRRDAPRPAARRHGGDPRILPAAERAVRRSL